MNFKKFEKQITAAGWTVLFHDTVVTSRGDVVASVDKHGEVHSKDADFLELLVDLVYAGEAVVEEKPLFEAETFVAKVKTKAKKKKVVEV